MAFEDLFAGLKMFQEGVRDYATTKALAEARSQIDMLNSQTIKQEEKFAAMNELSRGLTQQMMQIGATPQQVAQAASAFAPQQFENSEAMFKQGVMAGDSGLQQQAAKVQEFEQKPKRELMQIQSSRALITAQLDSLRADRSLGREQRKALVDAGKEFDSQTKESRTLLSTAASMKQALAKENPLLDTAMKTRFGRLSGNVGNPTEWEQRMFEGNPQFWEQVKQQWSRSVSTGRMTPENRKLFSQAVEAYGQAAADAVRNDARRNAEQVSSVYGFDPEDTYKKLLPPTFEQQLSQFGGKSQQPGQQQQQGSAAPARRSLLDYRE